jgi:hypothetical protein
VGGQCQQHEGQLPNPPSLPGDAVALEQQHPFATTGIGTICWLLNVACSRACTDTVLGSLGVTAAVLHRCYEAGHA